MSVKYEVHKIENVNGSGQSRPFIRLQQGKAMTAKQLETEIERSCTATESDVRAVMTELCHIAKRELSSGNRFYLPEIGYLSLSVGNVSPENLSNGKITGNAIYLRNIDFLPEAAFFKEIRGNVRFEKSTRSTLSVKYGEDELWQKVEAYLEENMYVTNTIMRSEFGLSKYMAAKWLDTFTEKGLLKKRGSEHQPLYFKG